MSFDPDAAARPGAGVFGLPHSRDEARIVLVPVPFDATTSYGGGAGGGPEAIRAASAQVDLYDPHFGRIYEAGIHMLDSPVEIAELSKRARQIAAPIIEKGGAEEGDADAVKAVDDAGARVNQHVYDETSRLLDARKVPGIVGGDHASPLGSIRACAERCAPEGGIGVLQIDAHMDLRESFEGFRWSHASIMDNALREAPGVVRIVQVGIRDFGEGELRAAQASEGRVDVHFDHEWHRRMDEGEPFASLCAEALSRLPELVYVSIDIDGLDPALCPHTGTPVPGGLGFNRAAAMLAALRHSGRRVVGFDLCEVSPGPIEGDEWDANVGARILYKLCGAARPS
ncbi:MAG: arginase [Phycisphaeraceae bacterium]|nr:MAG: arginase [Phycisphaeraceae bacterium]